MRAVAFALLALLIAASTPAAPAPPAAPKPPVAPPDSAHAIRPLGHAVFESERGPYLLGEVTRADILALHPEWEAEEKQYEPDRAAVAALAAVEREARIVCVLGTWCSDSEQQVPRFWKVLAAARNPRLRLQMFAVGRKDDAERTQPALKELGFAQDIRATYAAELVPTFVFYRLEEEIGRIVETPQASLEADAAAILSLLGEEPD